MHSTPGVAPEARPERSSDFRLSPSVIPSSSVVQPTEESGVEQRLVATQQAASLPIRWRSWTRCFAVAHAGSLPRLEKAPGFGMTLN